MRAFYTITDADVGKPLLRAFGKAWPVVDFMGRIMRQDIGKRVYLVRCDDGVSHILQVENQEQLEARLAAQGWIASVIPEAMR